MEPARRRWLLLSALALAAVAALLSLGPLSGPPVPEHDATPTADSPTPTAPPNETETPDETATRELRGTVRAADDGSPLIGARVSVENVFEERVSGPIETDPDGGFTLRTPTSGRSLMITAAGFADVSIGIPDDLDVVDVRLDRTARVTGLVLRATDRTPVARTRVHTGRAELLAAWRRLPENTSTDDRGRFELTDVAAGEMVVYALGGGWVSVDLAREFRPIQVSPGETLALELLVEPSVRLSGKVLDHDGRPVSAKVSARAQRSVVASTTQADESGAFVMADLVPDLVYTVSASVEGRALGRVDGVVPRSGETVEVEIRMPKPRSIDVLVTNRETGEPVAGAEVAVDGGGWVGSRTPTEDGRLRLGLLRPGALTLRAEHPEFQPMDDPVQVSAGHEGEVRIFLSPGLAVSGTVVFPDGTPLATGWVSANSRYEEFENGRFRLPGLSPGPVKVEASTDEDDPRGDWEGTTEARSGDTEIVVRLEEVLQTEREEPFVVRVVGPDGAPVPRAELYVTEDEDAWGDDTTVVLGRGEVDLSVDRRSALVQVCDARTSAGAPLPLGAVLAGPYSTEVKEVTVRLPPEMVISGTVLADGGDGVSGVELSATPVEPKGILGHAHRTTRTGPDGGFRLGGLWKGTYEIEVVVPEGYLAQTTKVTVESGAEGVELTLRRALTGVLTLVDPDGRPVAGAEVEAYLIPDDGNYVPRGGPTGVSDGEGVVELTGLEPSAKYLVKGSPQEGRSDLLETRWWDVRPGDRLIFDRALHVTATVPDVDVGNLVVWGRQAKRGSWLEGKISGEGVFTVGPFKAGDVALVVLERGVTPDYWGGRETVVPAGTVGVRLAFDAGHDLVVTVTGWPRGENTGGRLTIEETGIGHGGNSDADGVFRFSGLPGGRSFTFWCGPVAGDRYAYRTGIGADEREVTIALVRGRTVTGRLVTRTVMPGSVSLGGPGFRLGADVAPDGTFEIGGVPAGKWNVTANCCVTHEGRHCHSHGSAVAEPGKPVVLEMSDPR